MHECMTMLDKKVSMGSHRLVPNLSPKGWYKVKQVDGEVSLPEDLLHLWENHYTRQKEILSYTSLKNMNDLRQLRWNIKFKLWNYKCPEWLPSQASMVIEPWEHPCGPNRRTSSRSSPFPSSVCSKTSLVLANHGEDPTANLQKRQVTAQANAHFWGKICVLKLSCPTLGFGQSAVLASSRQFTLFLLLRQGQMKCCTWPQHILEPTSLEVLPGLAVWHLARDWLKQSS